MFCKNCGKEIADDSKFCNFCGSEQQSTTSISEKTSSTEEEKSSTPLWGIFFGCLIFIFIIVLIIVIVTNDNSSTPTSPSSDSSSTEYTTRSAKTSDLIINFKKTDNLFEADDYYMIIQAQEKITNLKLSIDYKDSSGRILKTETVYVGKVVPGNEYKFNLSLNGMNPSDLDKISKFSYKITSGTVAE
ncbi:MAG: zinc ribbon domain-containing protein [Clostridia bacterium]|nr:zinc ribbon domain-containing protein [Clostridia bacterium]